MKTLFINACVRDGSRTLRLAKRLLFRLGEHEEINLEAQGLDIWGADVEGILKAAEAEIDALEIRG